MPLPITPASRELPRAMFQRDPLATWLIDDEQFEFELLEATVKRERIPFRLRHFLTAEQAQVTLQTSERWERPQLIFCDIRMPGMDGFEFLRWLRASPFRCTPVVMRSNSDRVSDVNRAYELGANAYHTKPMHMDGLAARLRATFEYWCNIEIPDADWSQSHTCDVARRMGSSHEKILRVLSVVFSPGELNFLQTHPAFLKKLDAAAAKPQHEATDLSELCRIGGEILARYPGRAAD